MVTPKREFLLAKIWRSAKVIGLRVALEAAVYPARRRLGCGLFSRKAPDADLPWTSPGGVESFSYAGNTAAVRCERADLQITALSPEIVRVRLRADRAFPEPFSYAVAAEASAWPGVDVSVEQTTDSLRLSTPAVSVEIRRADAALRILAPGGMVLGADAAPMAWAGQRVALARQLPDGASVYGFGEKALPLDKRGHRMELWNVDCAGYGPGDDPLYMSIPFYLLHNGGICSGLFFDNSFRAYADVGAEDPSILRLEAKGGELRYYFFAGPTPADVLRQYTALTGRMELPPLWALGYHQNRWSYYPESRVREIAREFRQRRIPCDAIHLDIHYMDGYRSFTFHPERFPNPAALTDDLHREGFKVVAMVDPGIKADGRYTACRSGVQQDAFCRYPSGRQFKGPVWPGLCYFPDFSSVQAREWWGQQYKPLLDAGVDGFWNDMNEPAVFGAGSDTVPDCVLADWDGKDSTFREAHNVYGMLMVRASAEGLRRLRPERRRLIISRSGWAGLQRYGSHWTGDNQSDWPSLRLTIPTVLTLGLCGVAFTGPDTGGFSGSPSPELLVRWNQLSAFTPFFRNHTAFWTSDQEPWVHGDPYESLNRAAIQLRYRMLPAIYTAFWQCAQTGVPMMRPLALSFPDDAEGRTIEDEFMFGDHLLIAPVLEEGAESRIVYLPRGRWYDFWTGNLHEGPARIDVAAPLERIPVFAAAGSVVPAWPVMQYVRPDGPDRLTLHVFPGNGDGVLYEDAGEGFAYQEGEYRLSSFACHVIGGELSIGWSRKGRYKPNYSHVEIVVHGLEQSPAQVMLDGEPAEVEWDGAVARISTHVFEELHVSGMAGALIAG